MVAHGLTIPFAVRIPDWNHSIMNTMRNACEAVESWTRFLAEMRSLMKSFRNEYYRDAIQVNFRTSGQDADAPFRSFTAGFAKWRNETISEVVCQLAPLTSFVQQGFLGAFHRTKPEGWDEACKDVVLWVFS